MRILIALAAALSLPAAAHAGMRAIYADEKQKIVVEVADNGDARITPQGSDQYGILRSGELYIVGKEQGVLKVARLADFAAALDQVMPPVFKQIFGAAAKTVKSGKMRIEPQGAGKAAGRDGLVYAVYGVDDSKPQEPTRLVVSTDPRLRPVGKAMEEFMIGTTVLMAVFVGPVAAEMASDMRSVFALGTPLEMGPNLKLASFEQAEVPASATALPAEPQTVDQIVAELKAAAASQPGETDTGAGSADLPPSDPADPEAGADRPD